MLSSIILNISWITRQLYWKKKKKLMNYSNCKNCSISVQLQLVCHMHVYFAQLESHSVSHMLRANCMLGLGLLCDHTGEEEKQVHSKLFTCILKLHNFSVLYQWTIFPQCIAKEMEILLTAGKQKWKHTENNVQAALETSWQMKNIVSILGGNALISLCKCSNHLYWYNSHLLFFWDNMVAPFKSYQMGQKTQADRQSHTLIWITSMAAKPPGERENCKIIYQPVYC